MAADGIARSLRGAPRTAAFIAVSLLAHLGLLGVLGFAPAAADMGIELQVPAEVEFGLTDGTEMGEPEPSPSPPPAPARPEERPPAQQAAQDVDLGEQGPEVDAAVVDALEDLPPDGGVPSPDGGVADAAGPPALLSGIGDVPGAVGDGYGVGSGGHGMGGYAPPGAQIGLHADLDRIRETSLILETTALLDAIPEWQRMLNGSGINPLRDLSRVFVATPNLRRSHLVLSATYRGSSALVEQAVSKLARARRTTATWRTESGIRVAPWLSKGPTERVVALVGPQQLTITRPSDLPRVLAVANAVGRRNTRVAGMERAQGAAALLAMYRDEAVALSVEGVRTFVRGDVQGVPRSLRISVRHVDEFHTELTALGLYDDPGQAARALDFIDGLRLQWAEHPNAYKLGIRQALLKAQLTQDGAQLHLSGLLTLHQTRYLLTYVSFALKPRD